MAFAAVERLIAFRYLRARREEGFISVIAGFSLVGIALGVGTLIVVMAVMNGFRIEMLHQMSGISGQLGVQGNRDGLEPTPDLLARLRAVPGVTNATPTAEGQVMAVTGEQARGVLIRGMTPDDFRARAPLSAAIDGPPGVRERYRNLCRSDGDEKIDWGSLKDFGQGFSVAVGRRLADLMHLKVGDRVQLVSPVSVATPLGVMPRSVLVRVSAVFCAGMYDYDANFIYAPLADVQRLLSLGNKVTTIEVFVDDKTPLHLARQGVTKAVGLQGWVFDWFQANFGFFAAVQAQTNVMFLVLTMIVLVAAFNIVSSMVMLVRTKTGDIAILRTMGATRGAILRLFLLDGFAIGAVGTIVGVGLGLAFADNIEAIRQWLQHTFGLVLFDEQLYLLAEMPSHITGFEIGSIVAMAMCFSLAASVYPAWRASQLDPVEGLRRECQAPAVERWLAWRYLATRQREGFVSAIAIFSLIGVALGVATLIVVLSVMGGFREELIGRIIGMNGHVVITAKQGMLDAKPELLQKLRAASGVMNVRLTLERQALVTANGQTRGAVLRGVRLEDLLSRDIVTRNIVSGELGAFNTRRGVVMGEKLRQSLNVRTGDTITLVTQKLNETGAIAPRYSDYEVLASFLSKRFEFDGAFIFVPLEMLQDDLEYDHGTVSSIDLELKDPADAPQVAAGLRKSLGRDDLKVSEWEALNARFMGALQVERVMMFIILSLIVLVAALNVIASFTMLVRVKRGNIAILRTMGAGPGTIVRAFFMAAAGVGLVGTTIGAGLGLYICSQMPAIGRWLGSVTSPGAGAAEVDFVTSMPVKVEPVEVISIIVVAIVLSLAAAAYPAWRSAKVEPVEGLRHE